MKRKRIQVPQRIRQAVFQRDGHMCVYCGKPGKTIDHRIPFSREGKSWLSNLSTACFDCNNKKADLSSEEWNRKQANEYSEGKRKLST